MSDDNSLIYDTADQKNDDILDENNNELDCLNSTTIVDQHTANDERDIAQNSSLDESIPFEETQPAVASESKKEDKSTKEPFLSLGEIEFRNVEDGTLRKASVRQSFEFFEFK